MNIPQSILEPFGYTGMPKLSSNLIVALIDEVLSKFFFAIDKSNPDGLGVRMEMAARIAGASDSNCSIEYVDNGFWAHVEYRISKNSYWNKRTFLSTYDDECEGG